MLENPQTERVATTENPFTPPTEGQASVGMQENDPSQAYDFTYVPTIARIALYDDLRSAPRITEIQPATTAEYIENLASKIYEQAKLRRRNHSLHGHPGSNGELHPRPLRRDHRLHPGRRQHHPVRRPRPGHQPEGEGPAARVHVGHRTHEALHPRRRFGPAHRQGIPGLSRTAPSPSRTTWEPAPSSPSV